MVFQAINRGSYSLTHFLHSLRKRHTSSRSARSIPWIILFRKSATLVQQAECGFSKSVFTDGFLIASTYSEKIRAVGQNTTQLDNLLLEKYWRRMNYMAP
uniref:Uncharacterized protein n=1 Tax=Schistocephalus solidus TaxID=70667 RepID=A0A0X3PMJ0_SCHSO